MPFVKGKNPKGNPGNKGNKVGRKSAYQELKNAERLQAIWKSPGLTKELQERVRDGTATLEDIFLLKGIIEDVRPLIEIFKKLHPDTLDITSKGDKIIPIFGGVSINDSDNQDILPPKAD